MACKRYGISAAKSWLKRKLVYSSAPRTQRNTDNLAPILISRASRRFGNYGGLSIETVVC